MKDTNRRHNTLWAFLILTAFFTQASSLSMAQHSSAHNTLSILMDSAEILQLKGKFDSAILLCNKVDEESQASSDWESQARALNELSDIHRNIKDYDKAEKFSKKGNDVIQKHNLENTVEYPRNIFYTGKILNYAHLSDLNTVKDSIQYYYSRALQVNNDLAQPNKNFTVELLFGLGYFHQVLGNIDEANHYYNELISLLDTQFEETEYRRGLYLYYISIFMLFLNVLFTCPAFYNCLLLLNLSVYLSISLSTDSFDCMYV